jgi:zinc/manganese transport system substrate-binding protein
VVVAKVLSDTKPEYAEDFKKGLKKFQTQMTELKSKIDQKLKPLQFLARGRPLVIEYHKEFTYFFDVYGLKSFGSIEEKPGVPPSGTRLAEVAKAAKEAKVCMALGALYAPENQLQKFTEISGIIYKRLPAMVQKNNTQYNSIEKLQNALADAILSCPLLSAKDKG